MEFWHRSNHLTNQCFPGRQEFVQLNRFSSHADKTSLELCRDVFAPNGEDLGHRSIVADKIDQESSP